METKTEYQRQLAESLIRSVVDVLKSKEDSRAIIMTAPNGVSCLLATGKHWQAVVAKAEDTPR